MWAPEEARLRASVARVSQLPSTPRARIGRCRHPHRRSLSTQHGACGVVRRRAASSFGVKNTFKPTIAKQDHSRARFIHLNGLLGPGTCMDVRLTS